MLPTLATRLVLQSSASSPLGRMTLAGYIKDGVGVTSPRVLGSYAVVYLLEGEGRFRDSERDLPLRAGHLLLIFPNVPHVYGPQASRRWSEFYIVFDGPAFDLWRRQGVIDPARPLLSLEPIPYWLARLHEAASEENASVMERICLLQRILAEAISISQRQSVAQQDVLWLEQAQRHLEASAVAGRCELSRIAGELGMSYENFRKRFVRLAGLPPARYRSHCLMRRVCDLLQHTDQPLRSIARECGFCDEFHLSRRFRSSMGISPSGFRRQLGR